MPIILKKRLLRPFYKKLGAQTGFGGLTACQIVTDAVSSIKEISDNFSDFSFVNYLVPVGIFAEATVYHQNIEGGADYIKLTSEKGYLSYHFRQAFDFHLAQDPHACQWKSGNIIPQSSEEEDTSLESTPVKKESESEDQLVDQGSILVTDHSATQKDAYQAPGGQDVILGSEWKHFTKEKKFSIFSGDDESLFDAYRLNQCILNFPELVFTLEGVLKQKEKRLQDLKNKKTQENSSQQDKEIRTLESDIQKLQAQKLKKETLNSKVLDLQSKIAELQELKSFINKKIAKLEAKKLNEETPNEKIAHLKKKIRKNKLKAVQESKSSAEKEIHNLEKDISELENSLQELERTALDEERRMAEQRLIFLENYMEEAYFERIAQAKKSLVEGASLTPEQQLLIALIKEEKRKKLYLRLALAASIFLAVASSVAVYYISFSVFSTLAFLAPLLPFMPYILIALAIFAAIGTAFLVYNTLADIILQDKGLTLNAIWDWFSRGENESRGKHVFRIILAVTGIIISCAAIAAVGYTIYAQLLPILGPIAAVFAMLPCVLSEFIFIMKNSVESIGMLEGECDIGSQFKKFFLDFKTAIASENLLQWSLHLIRLPLKLLLLVFKLAIFVLHVGVTAVSSDRLPYVPPFIVMMISALSEVLTDFSQLFSNKDDEAEHGHDHGGGPLGLFQKLFFITPALILGSLNYLFSQLNRLSLNPKKEYLSFKEAINQELIAFEIKHSHQEEEKEERQYAQKIVNNTKLSTPEAAQSSRSSPLATTPVARTDAVKEESHSSPQQSTAAAKEESKLFVKKRTNFFPIQVLSQPLKKEIKRLESKKSQSENEKIDFFRDTLSVIENKTISESDKIKEMSKSDACLKKHRSLWHLPYTKTTSAKKWDEMRKICEGSSYDLTLLRCTV